MWKLLMLLEQTFLILKQFQIILSLVILLLLIIYGDLFQVYKFCVYSVVLKVSLQTI